MDLIQQLNWRYAVKRMTGEQVPEEKVERILEAIRLSASSMGLQPYTVLVVSNPALLKQIQAEAIKQPQVGEASHLLVFAAWWPVKEEQVDAYMQHIAEVRDVPVASLNDFRNSILGLVHSRSDEMNFNWAARQAYIALGTGLAAAAMEEVDATPMEGFDPQQLDEVLQLREKGLRSAVAMVLGYRDVQNDPMAQRKKVRREKENLFIRMK